jgi:hypothetical protein
VDASTGPFLQMAIFCERVLEEKDGVLSVIRIVDRVTHRAAGPIPPEDMPPFPLNLMALISFKFGQARGRHTLTLRPLPPSGLLTQELPQFSVPVLFDGGEDRGVNVILNIGMQVRQEGVYWFEVRLDDATITRMPLRVVYEWMTLGTSLHP